MTERTVDPLEVRIERRQDAAATRRILESLPEWFGIPEANEHYIKVAGEMPSYLAVAGDTVVGALLLPRHFAGSAEVYLIAVHAASRGRGVGRMLLDAAESDLRADGVTLLQVKTLGPSRPDPHYERTRRFYEHCGFQPLEELLELWGENPCLVMVKPL